MTHARLTTILPLLAAAVAVHPAGAASTINGGGAASQVFNYAAPDANGVHVAEMPLFDSLQSGAVFGTYWATTSGAAQLGLLNNDLSCISNKATGQNGGNCNGIVGGAETVHYAVSESVLTSTQLASWMSAPVDQAAAGNLIQIPMLGTGLAVVVNDAGLTANGQAGFSDSDLCEIFSGKVTDFSQILDAPSPLTPNPITVLYRTDSAGTTFLLTNHLSAVCNAQTSNVTFFPSSSFIAQFGTGKPPSNFVGISGLSTLANTLAGLTATQYPSAVSYISPDWTSLDSSTSSAKLSNGQPSPLLDAELENGRKFYLPTATNIGLGLTHPGQGGVLTPPTTASDGANPLNWVPVVQTTKVGYPMVGYSTFDLPQCYADPAIATAMIAFLTDHYTNQDFLNIQSNNGLFSLGSKRPRGFLRAVERNILANHSGWNTDIQNATACAGKTGR